LIDHEILGFGVPDQASLLINYFESVANLETPRESCSVLARRLKHQHEIAKKYDLKNSSNRISVMI
jgi:hypothetical protein